jgi:frizzled protein 5/8
MNRRACKILVCLALMLNLSLANVLAPNTDVVFNERKMLFEKRRCEPITVPMCRGLDYNLTTMPNQFNHETQDDAAMEVRSRIGQTNFIDSHHVLCCCFKAQQFWPLVEINCSKDLKFFLCSMYTPICIEGYTKPVRPCKSVCQRVRIGCEKFMQKYGFDWPESMSCDAFPEYGSDDVCMDPIDALANKKISDQKIQNVEEIEDVLKSNKEPKPTKALCRPSSIEKLFQTQTNALDDCIQPCYDGVLTEKEKKFSSVWLLFLAISCLMSSSLTTITYLIEKQRFKYPEKPIIYLCMCYVFVSSGYLLQYFSKSDSPRCDANGSLNQSLVMQMNTSCVVIFILTYYFTMASAMWWAVTALTWFMAAGLKWGIESIAKYDHYFHLMSWLVPSIMTIVVLGLGLIDSDPISGICSVGNANTHNMHLFVIAPLLVTLLVGIGFLLLGFVSLFRLRNTIREQRQQQQINSNTDKLEALMLRIGIFAVLYTVPTTCLIACNFYQQHYRIEWENSLICQQSGFLDRQLASDHPCFIYSNNKTEKKPEFTVFMLKYLSSLVIGIFSGFWICSQKTLYSWKCFAENVLCFYRQRHNAKNKANIYFRANKLLSIDSKDNQQNVYQFPAVAQDPNAHGLNYYNIVVNDQHEPSNCHTNKAVAFNYDFLSMSTKTDKLTDSSKSSMISS